MEPKNETIIDNEDFCVADKDALLAVVEKFKKEGVSLRAVLAALPDKNSQSVKIALWNGLKKKRYAMWGITEIENPLEFSMVKTIEKAIVFYEEYLMEQTKQNEGDAPAGCWQHSCWGFIPNEGR